MTELNDEVGELDTFALIENLEAIKDWAEKCWLDSGFQPDKMSAMILAIEEAFANVCFHAYRGESGPVKFKCLKYPDNSLVYKIYDWASPFDVIKAADPDTKALLGDRKIGGLGILMIKQMADQVDWEFQNNSNVLSLKFKFSDKRDKR